ncbi:MAG: amidohydrolase family protein [Candidatus Merdivicinus sp.]
MVLDCHIHMEDKMDPPQVFAQKLNQAGVDGGIVFSNYPASFFNGKAEKGNAQQRLQQVLDFTKNMPLCFPFFFIDPMEDDALDQVDQAVASGIAGFKAICCHHYPQDDRAMKVWERIASYKKPLLLHSGILYNNSPSAEYNRPANFEHLFYIDGLRFAMAHISWPWVDELIAVFGKWHSLHRNKDSHMTAELFVDMTPGTPPIYREEALTKLLTVGYALLPERLMFGTDSCSVYASESSAWKVERDRAIYQRLGISEPIQNAIFADNLKHFVGLE